ncbi:MAG TPA: helix-turn-helix domain-containing protein [Slackia equolifaciens]|uniref:Helix-turn-helix domain-containing protein n=1 Tax=Slackia equolifaciens TaxID=498718 RepID=A0A9D3A190_9ACTN|nr:helix-turn-helix domain-containing protein [Slackia equolifaciens]
MAEYVPDSGWLILYANTPARKMFGLGLIDFGTKVYGSLAALDAVEFSDDAADDEPERAARDRALQAGLAELLERSPLPAEASTGLAQRGVADAESRRTGAPYRLLIEPDPANPDRMILRAFPMGEDRMHEQRDERGNGYGTEDGREIGREPGPSAKPEPWSERDHEPKRESQPEPDSNTTAAKGAEHQIAIRTFGYFDVFVDGNPIPFRSEKAKELLALLVDRRGGFVSSSEAISVLWEDEPLTEQSRARYRKVAMKLRETLEEHHAEQAIETVRGKRRVVPEHVSCDLYDHLSGTQDDTTAFRGAYLQNYSWGEFTLAELLHA